MDKNISVNRILFLVLLFNCIGLNGSAQEIRFDNLKEQFAKKNLFKMNGGISANSTLYWGDNASRQRHTWMIAGNVNFTLLNYIQMPFSCNINNLGKNYKYPSLPNRFSLHPSYKWATAHIGDVSVNYSPYTLNGHQFTGVGIELQPDKIPFRFSAMYGRLLKATEYDSIRSIGTAAYKRMGYGLKVEYEHKDFLIDASLFHAHDVIGSLSFPPDSLQIFPQSNIAFNIHFVLRVLKNLSLEVDNGFSYITRDTRLSSGHNNWWFERNGSTKMFHAVNVRLNYQFYRNVLGVGYERVDPDYHSLGAYYFTNDLENITLTYARPFWNNKINFSLNLGMQHDNLDRNKVKQTNRWVGAANLNIAPVERLSLSLSYSNFQSYTNIKSQFDYINSTDIYENMDTLDFSQLSQSLMANIGYHLIENESNSQNLNLSLSFQETSDKYEGDTLKLRPVQYYNGALSYGLSFKSTGLRIATSFNCTFNKMENNNSSTFGPGVTVSSPFLNKKITATLSTSYNISMVEAVQTGRIFNTNGNVRWNFFKWHHLSWMLVYQNRYNRGRGTSSDFTSTISYGFAF